MRWVVSILMVVLTGCDEPFMAISGSTMGTTFQVKIARDEGALDARVLAREIDARLDEVNRQMSTYRKDSEISRFNRSRSTNWGARLAGLCAGFARCPSNQHLVRWRV